MWIHSFISSFSPSLLSFFPPLFLLHFFLLSSPFFLIHQITLHFSVLNPWMAPHCSQISAKLKCLLWGFRIRPCQPLYSCFLSHFPHSPPRSWRPSFSPTLATSVHPQALAHAVPSACHALPSQLGLVHFSAIFTSQLSTNPSGFLCPHQPPGCSPLSSL